MKVRECLDKLDSFTICERAMWLPKLIDRFCALSRGAIWNFQNHWDSERSWEEFLKEQNEVIKTCIRLETSDTGTEVRMYEDLDPLTLDDEL